jgi:hypothetical protein
MQWCLIFFCRGNGFFSPPYIKNCFISHTPIRQTPDNDEVNISVECCGITLRTLLMSPL